MKTNLNINQWWNNLSIETKNLFSGMNSQETNNDNNSAFWLKLQLSDKRNIYKYWQYRKGIIQMDDDDANSLLMEIICELVDLKLEKNYGKPREDMCNDEGCFHEKYQESFNDLYDDIEDLFLSYNFYN